MRRVKLTAADRRFLHGLAVLVAHDFVKNHGEKRVADVELELAKQVEDTTVNCLEVKL